MAISIQKTLPTSSNWYIGSGGDTTITLNGVERITVNGKKTLIKIKIPKSKSRRTATLSDEPDNRIIDLKKVEQTIKIKGWLEDDATGGETAWDKAWQLYAMMSTGGALTKLTIENLEFDSDSQQAFLEDVTFLINPTGHTTINTLSGQGDEARVEIDLAFYIGKER